MKIDWLFKPFHELTPEQLYAILKLRVDTFMIEQKCFYEELDGEDQASFHLMGFCNGQLGLYARIFPPGHNYHGRACPEARIGRIATHKSLRGKGLGHALIKEAVGEIEKRFGNVTSIMDAQSHLEKFYNTHGFVKDGAEYLEDDIPHIPMKRQA